MYIYIYMVFVSGSEPKSAKKHDEKSRGFPPKIAGVYGNGIPNMGYVHPGGSMGSAFWGCPSLPTGFHRKLDPSPILESGFQATPASEEETMSSVKLCFWA